MRSLIHTLLRFLAVRQGRCVGMYRRICAPDGTEWAAYLKAQDILFEIGDNCSVQTNVTITDPKYVRLGNNVRLSGCTLFGHDGSVNMINRAYHCKVDNVGKIDIRDNVFVGHGAILLPGLTIGPNAIVAAGSVVTRDVVANSVVAGVPARRICSLDEYVERLKHRTEQYPWADLIAQREGSFDPGLQPQLDRIRLEYFFG